jgi:ABC-type branched-subunit amino acid transport system substrate-binding protein
MFCTKKPSAQHKFMRSFPIEERFSLYGIRHDFVVILAAAARIAAGTPLVAQVAPTLRVGLVSIGNPAVSTASSIERGVRLGASEAKQTANLFGGDVLLFEAVAAGDPTRAAQKLLSERKVDVLLGSLAQDADALSQFADLHRLIFVNVASRALSLRASCRRYTLHVEASDSMYAIAARRAGRQSAFTGNRVVLWAPTLERYGASQINDRYRARYRLPMNGGAWAGWVAVKIVAEAALRARSSHADEMLSYLESPAANFDGHKGWPLSFRLGDHQLRQPLYVVSPPSPGAARVALREIPEISAMAEGDEIAGANRALETLMPSSPGCSRARHR